MTDDKQVVIKINYAGNRNKNTAGTHTEPEMVTEWYIKRIIIAFVILIFIVACGIFLWLGQRGEETTNIDQTSKEVSHVPAEVKEQTLEVIEEVRNESEKVPVEVVKSHSTVVEVIKEKMDTVSRDMQNEILEIPVNKQVNAEGNIIEQSPDKKVINIDNSSISEEESEGAETGSELFPKGLKRAVITSSIWKKGPVDKLTSPIIVKKGRARSVFYFTELTGMKGKAFFHVWKYKEKVKFRKKIKVLGDRWRASTSKLMNYSSIGDWSVQLTNAEGKVMNEIHFTIIGS